MAYLTLVCTAVVTFRFLQVWVAHQLKIAFQYYIVARLVAFWQYADVFEADFIELVEELLQNFLVELV